MTTTINKKNNFGFGNFNPGEIKTTPMELETIEVSFERAAIFDTFIQAFMYKIEIDGSHIQRHVQLTEEEATYYFEYLLHKRVEFLVGRKVNFDLLNQLWVPAFVETALAMIGKYVNLERNFQVVPVLTAERDFDEDRIRAIGMKFMRLKDVTNMVEGGLCRRKEGDAEVMTTACIAGFVRSMSEVSSPIMTYFTGFLNTKIVEEASFKMLYRVQYDDILRMQGIFSMQGDSLC